MCVMYVHIFISVYHVCIYIYFHMCTCIYVYMYLCKYVSMYICINVCTNIHVSMYLCISVYTSFGLYKFSTYSHHGAQVVWKKRAGALGANQDETSTRR